jgi:hypothetical protein
VVPALPTDPAGPAVAPAVVDVLGEQPRDRGRLVDEERDQGVDRTALRAAHGE